MHQQSHSQNTLIPTSQNSIPWHISPSIPCIVLQTLNYGEMNLLCNEDLMRVCQNVISVLPVAIEMVYEVIGNVSMFG